MIKEGARAREYEDAPQWLVDARLVHKVYRSTAPGLPVVAYDDLSAFQDLFGRCRTALPLGPAGSDGFWGKELPVH